jgi:hypothetical protein
MVGKDGGNEWKSWSKSKISEFGWEVNQGQVNIRWMTMPAAPDGILETLTVVVSLDVQQPRTRLDVQQDVVPVKKQI